MEPILPILWKKVAQISERSARDHGHGWETVALYQSPESEFCLAGQGGPESDWGKKHGPLVAHRERIEPEAARAIIAAMGCRE